MQATIMSGAIAWSADGKREFGRVPESILSNPVTIIGGVVSDKGSFWVIDDPLWEGSKRWAVLKPFAIEITDSEPPPPDPDPDPEPDPEPEPETVTFEPGILQLKNKQTGASYQNTVQVVFEKTVG